MNRLELGSVQVFTALPNRGHSPEFWAERATKSIINDSKVNPVIEQQARAFRRQVKEAVLFHVKQAIRSDRATVAGFLEENGYAELARQVREMKV